MFPVEKCRGGHRDTADRCTILREFPRTEYSMTGQGQQIMAVALWGTYTRPRIALEPSFS